MTASGGSAHPRVAVAQTAPRLGEVAANLAGAERTIAALGGRADLILFPELFTTGYNRELLDHAALAELLPDGPTARRLAGAAASAGIAVAGTILERAGRAVFDTAVVFDARGTLVARYRKTHLHPEEIPVFGQGDELRVVALGSLRLGLAICFEHAFPEIFAELALAGANVIVIPSAVPEGYEYLLELRTRARAQDNAQESAAGSGREPSGSRSTGGSSARAERPAARSQARFSASCASQSRRVTYAEGSSRSPRRPW